MNEKEMEEYKKAWGNNKEEYYGNTYNELAWVTLKQAMELVIKLDEVVQELEETKNKLKEKYRII